jgi:RND superfamily putative drug exporter
MLPPEQGDRGRVLIEAAPADAPSSPQLGATIDRLRGTLPPGALVGGAAAENHDLEAALAAKTPIVIGVVLGLGFVLLLVAFQAPLAAAIGVLPNLLATAAAFGVAKLIFQDGHLAGLLGFEHQGFLDAWAPVFFFAMIFAISMDYTVFILSSTKERWDRDHDARSAMVGGLAQSGHVINAAGALMVAVFFTFALSGPLPPKEMGIVLGVAVLLDSFLVRLLLVPVLLRLAGPAAWYVPRWLGRILPKVQVGERLAGPLAGAVDRPLGHRSLDGEVAADASAARPVEPRLVGDHEREDSDRNSKQGDRRDHIGERKQREHERRHHAALDVPGSRPAQADRHVSE